MKAAPSFLDYPDRRRVVGIDGQDDPVVALPSEWSQGQTRVMGVRVPPMLGTDRIADVTDRHAQMPARPDPEIDMADHGSVIEHDLEMMGRGEPSRAISGQDLPELQMDCSGTEGQARVRVRGFTQSSLLRSEVLTGSPGGDGDARRRRTLSPLRQIRIRVHDLLAARTPQSLRRRCLRTLRRRTRKCGTRPAVSSPGPLPRSARHPRGGGAGPGPGARPPAGRARRSSPGPGSAPRPKGARPG